jgi:hypothetical protein
VQRDTHHYFSRKLQALSNMCPALHCSAGGLPPFLPSAMPSSIPSHSFHIFFITSSYLFQYDKLSERMERSLHIAGAIITIGLLLTPAAIQAQSAKGLFDNAGTEPPRLCDGIVTAKHSFNVRLHHQISSIVNKIRSKITGNGGRFEGDTKCGYFHGKSVLGTINGEYRSISDTEVEITIEDKPFILPYSVIECRIKEYLS